MSASRSPLRSASGLVGPARKASCFQSLSACLVVCQSAILLTCALSGHWLECFDWLNFRLMGHMAVLGLSDAHPVFEGGGASSHTVVSFGLSLSQQLRDFDSESSLSHSESRASGGGWRGWHPGPESGTVCCQLSECVSEVL